MTPVPFPGYSELRPLFCVDIANHRPTDASCDRDIRDLGEFAFSALALQFRQTVAELPIEVLSVSFPK